MNQKYRLKKATDIEELVKQKKAVGNPWFFVYFRDNPSLQIAVSVSKKLGNAVVRNKEKRIIREIARKNMSCFKSGSYLIVEKKSALGADYASKEKNLLQLIARIGGEKENEKK